MVCITPLLEAKLTERPTAHWVEALNAKDVPSGAILSLAEALSQPQVEHRRTLTSVRVDDEIVGRVDASRFDALLVALQEDLA